MKLIVDIPECFYEYCKAQEDAIEIQLAVKNGIPIPETHEEAIEEHTTSGPSGSCDEYVSKLSLQANASVLAYRGKKCSCDEHS